MKMLLIHDLGEIGAGDTVIYSAETEENKKLERSCIQKLFQLLPEASREEFSNLWDEFEEGVSPKQALLRQSNEFHLYFTTFMVKVLAGKTQYTQRKVLLLMANAFPKVVICCGEKSSLGSMMQFNQVY